MVTDGSAVLGAREWNTPERFRIEVDGGEVTIEGEVSDAESAELLASFIERVPGVVGIRSRHLAGSGAIAAASGSSGGRCSLGGWSSAASVTCRRTSSRPSTS